MKPSWIAALVALQLATIGLVVGLLLRGNAESSSADLVRLRASLDGALNQERVIIRALENLRSEAAQNRSLASPASPVATGDIVEPARGEGPRPPETERAAPSDDAFAKSPFPQAARSLADLKKAERALRSEIKNNSQNVAPLRTEIDFQLKGLIGRGHEALFVVRPEVELQPYEPTRDVKFIEFLLDRVVPALSAADKRDAFDIARGALVRQTNEAPIKFAAARALQQIDSEGWVKDVCDVIQLGSPREVGLREQLLGLFIDSPRREAVDLCLRFLDDARNPPELRVKALMVLEKQDSAAINPALKQVLFDDPAQLMKNHALDILMLRMKDAAERRKLLEDVLAENPARMPETVQEKARHYLEQLDAAGAGK